MKAAATRERKAHTYFLQEIRESTTDKTQKLVAEELGVNPSTYNSWERGVPALSSDTLIMLSRHFGCTPNDILGFETESSFSPYTEAETMLVSLFRRTPREVQDAVFTILNNAAKGPGYPKEAILEAMGSSSHHTS